MITGFTIPEIGYFADLRACFIWTGNEQSALKTVTTDLRRTARLCQVYRRWDTKRAEGANAPSAYIFDRDVRREKTVAFCMVECYNIYVVFTPVATKS